MTVKELIAELEKIEDKDLDVVFHDDDYVCELVEEVTESEAYYGKDEKIGWSACTRKCIIIS